MGNRKQKIQQLSFKNNVRSVRNTDRRKLKKEEALAQDPIDDYDKAMFETLGE